MKHEIKTYLSYTSPLDPVQIRTMADLEMSYALSSTLVEWNTQRELVASVAESWHVTGPNEMTFTVSKKAKWSDGHPITSSDIVKSFESARAKQESSLRGLFGIVEKIISKKDGEVSFVTNVPVATSGIVEKTAEPMLGINKIKPNGGLDLGVSSGPFYLAGERKNELTLKVNPHWINFNTAMADTVIIKRPATGAEIQNLFLKEKWANLLTATGLVEKSTVVQIEKEGYKIWARNLDRTAFFTPSAKLPVEIRNSLIQFLNQHLNRKAILEGIDSNKLADEFYPPGFPLYHTQFKKADFSKVKLPQEFQKRPLQILTIAERVNEQMKTNLKQVVKKAAGLEPILKIVDLSEMEKTRIAGQYDLFFVSIPVNDPNFDATLSFLFELEWPFIPSGLGDSDYKKRIGETRHLQSADARNEVFKSVLDQAVNDGAFLPLFHLATKIFAKPNLDFSAIPITDETVAFSKVRFK